jgi:hypothetical protein
LELGIVAVAARPRELELIHFDTALGEYGDDFQFAANGGNDALQG